MNRSRHAPGTWLGVVGCGLLALSACGGDSDSPGVDVSTAPVTITFLRHDNPNYVIADKQFFEEYMRLNPHVTIEDTTVSFNGLDAQLIGDLKQDRFAYDLVLVPPSRICAFKNNLTDVPADVLTLPQAQNAIFRAPLEGSICGGKLKGLPIEYNLEYGGVVVNLDKYRAKFGDKTPGWADWASFVAEAAMLTEYAPDGRPLVNGLDIDPNWAPPIQLMLLAGILQRGGEYWMGRPEQGAFNFDTAQARESFAALVELFTQHKVMHRSLVPPSNSDVTRRLASGATGYGWSDPAQPLSAMGYVGTWGLQGARAQLPAGSTWRFDFYTVPPLVGTRHRFVQDSGWAFAVPNTSRNPKAAWAVAKALALSPEAMRRWSAVTGALPALRANATPEAAAAAADTHPALAKVQPLLEHGRWRGYVPSAALAPFDGVLLRNFFAVVDGTMAIPDALRDIQMTANEAIVRHSN